MTGVGGPSGRRVPNRPPRPAAQEDALLAELKRTNHLLAVMAVKGMEQRQAIAFLDGAGFRPADIATAIGVTRNAVSITLHRIRKATGSQLQDGRDEEESPDDAQ